MNAVIEQVTYRYTCGCSATGGPLLPTYCPEHGTSEKPEPAVPVSALRALCDGYREHDDDEIIADLLALCDAAEGKP